MNMSTRRLLLLALGAALAAGCTSRETKDALQKANALTQQKQYQSANSALIDALRTREAKLRAGVPAPADQAAADALLKKVQRDGEILKLERAQVPLYLHLERADLASAVYADICKGSPKDDVVYASLKDSDPIMRVGAARVIGLAGQDEAIAPLTTASKDADKDVRRAAVAALGAIKNPAAVPALLDALKDSYWFVRSEAADALGRSRDLRAVEPLFAAVPDADNTVQSAAENALLALANLQDSPGDAFAAHLNDANSKVVTIAAICLAVKRDKRATPVLLKLATSPDVQTRLHAVKALGETGDPTVIPTLRQTLGDTEINVRGWSIIGLGKLNDRESVPALRAIAANTAETPNIRNAAAASINHLTGETNPPPVQP